MGNKTLKLNKDKVEEYSQKKTKIQTDIQRNAPSKYRIKRLFKRNVLTENKIL